MLRNTKGVELVRYIYTFLILIGLSGSAFGNTVRGEYLCKIVYDDGSGHDSIVRITGKEMSVLNMNGPKKKYFVEIYRDNHSRVFVPSKTKNKNAMVWSTQLIVLSSFSGKPKEVHYVQTELSEHVGSINKRIVKGICKPI